ncbi:binding-protein-dependent transport system inner membrane component, partial [marine sediment metagenome]
MTRVWRAGAPILTVLLVIIAIWYLGAVRMNATWERDQAARAGVELTTPQMIVNTLTQDRPILPAPHQVAVGLYDGIA